MRSASCSAEPVGSVKYAATVAVKSLIETEVEKERERIRRKNRIAIIVLRHGSALITGGTIVRIVRSLLPTAVSWETLKKDTELTTLLLAIYADRVLSVVAFIVVVVVVVVVSL